MESTAKIWIQIICSLNHHHKSHFTQGGFSGSILRKDPPPKGILSLLSIEILIVISILIHIERIIDIRLRLHTIKSTKRMLFTLYREKHILPITITVHIEI